MADTTHLCYECWDTKNREVDEYHKIQDSAREDVANGSVDEAIIKLEIVMRMRNEVARFFYGSLDNNHEYFANVFIPSLIDALRISLTPLETWDLMLENMREDNELC